MKIKTINLKIEELINIYKNILFVKNNSSPFFTFDESTCSGHQTIHYSSTDNHKYYIFLLGIKLFRCNKYHLNVIFYNKYQTQLKDLNHLVMIIKVIPLI